MSKKKTKFSQFDEEMMKRCFQLAKQGSGFVSPNPMVGAVIVKDGEIIAEGYHEYFGGPHAEINAIAKAEQKLEGAHIYVNLEPCSHYGKTPPCSLALIQQKFAKVFIASLDPNPQVAGRGVEAMRKAGIEVETGLLEEEALKLNEKFFHFITKKTPFIALKTACSLDGKIATSKGDSKWITGEKSRAFVHELRQDYSAILVGSKTVLQDNPALTIRNREDKKNPIRIIVDTSLKTPLDAQVLNHHDQVIIATSRMASKSQMNEFNKIENVQVWDCPLKNWKVDLEYLFNKLGEEGIDSVLIEGGGEINFNVLENRLANKIYAFMAPIIIGGQNSKSAFGGNGFLYLKDAARIKNISYTNYESDILMEGYF